MGGLPRCLLAAGCLLATVALSSGIAVMSIDFGSEWIKVGVVSPGVPLDIALNRESKRKTPAAMALRDGERIFGEDALTTGVRFPALSYQYLLRLAGKQFDNPAVAQFAAHFPYYTLEKDPARGTVLFRHDAETTFSVEELLSMIVTQARVTASEHTGQTVTDAVITVPAFFSQPERRAVLTAAALAGVKVLQLINDNAAVALNYGMFRRSDFNATTQYIMFYDIGADSTAASLVGYQLVKTKERGFTETNPQLQVLGYAYDRTLGGLEMTMRLRDHLAKVFTKNKRTKEDIYSSPRALAKLLKEAERVKKILSANAETVAQVEGLLDEEDFRHTVTRAEFEDMCGDLFGRVVEPLDAAAQSAGVPLDAIDQLILVGAGTRVPRIQEMLQKRWGRELGKSVNTDEAAALGAVYRAADLSTGFKVMKFHIKDYVKQPIGVDFERDSEEGGVVTTRKVHRNLFTLGNPYPQKKVITFNRSQQDFGFTVNLGDLSHLPPEEVSVIGGQNLSYVLLDGVADIYAKHSGEGVDSKGIKVHFQMDDSGLLHLTGAEAVFEKRGAGVEEDQDDAGTLAKLSSAFSNLFSGDEEKDKDGNVEEGESDSTARAAKDKDAKKEKKDTDKKEDKKEDKDNNKTADETNKTAKAKEDTPKVKVVKVPIKFHVTNLNVPDLEGEALEKAKLKIADLDEADRQRKRREQARNALESYTNELQSRLYDEPYEEASTEEERDTLRTKASEMSDWLYEEGFHETAAVFEEKLDAMKKLTKALYDRVEEHQKRPDAVQALLDMLNATDHFITQSEDSVKQEIISETDLSGLKKMVNSTKEWLKAKQAEQKKTPLTESPKLRLKPMAEKYVSLDKEVKYVVTKLKVGAAKKIRDEADARAKEAAAKAEEELKKKAKAAEAASNETGEGAAEPPAEQGEAAPAADQQQAEEEKEATAEPSDASEENDAESDKRKDEEQPSPELHTEL
ncbi:hypoxia up-regulated protein 1-like [Amphibalanus amphitrite]|uniref:hypoxia up-regulated protein 1-like n=1 Tax=Amphibalanus amphitrite TaxID=1232801 RepID=UPI001C92983A|nr:hypoxia up-regulated protein 1-like [Amphibalanus amphitrite]XP_043238714.1 hypoxia up-regulated protein 1-like [Amphibalanus amphitrite]